MILFLFLLIFLFGLNTAQQEQNFIIKPVNTNVVLGDTALLKCSVTPKHGDVQWIHDGTALGYDRKVPGKPRYAVTWVDNEDQEYHLQIINVTLDDEGVYACQVAPIGDWDTKLEEKVRLSALVAPASKPEITFNNEAKNDLDIVHIRESEIKNTKFRCRLGKSKPVSLIKWFLNNTLITNLTAAVVDVVPKEPVFAESQSTLEFRPTTQFNNSLLRCQAYHLAYGLNVEIANMSTSLRLVIVCKCDRFFFISSSILYFFF